MARKVLSVLEILQVVSQQSTIVDKDDSSWQVLAERWCQVVSDCYNEKQRHYHTLEHVEDMLSHIATHWDQLTDPYALSLATIFHDIVYDPRAGDNEDKSAELFMEYSKEAQLDVSLSSKVADWILKTKMHTTTQAHVEQGQYGSDDLHYFLDIDLAILGYPPQKYDCYAGQIRQEYIHIPEEIYCKNRAEILCTFLQTANLFATRAFRDRYEVQARDNLQREIEALRQGIIPQ